MTDPCVLNVYYNGVKFGEYTAGIRAEPSRPSVHSGYSAQSMLTRIRNGIVHAFVHESTQELTRELTGGPSSPAKLSCSSGNNMIRGYFAKSSAVALSSNAVSGDELENPTYDLFVGFISSRMTPDPPARVYRVVWEDEITILGIYREATDADWTAAKMGRECPGVESAAKNTDFFRVVNGVRITVII